MLLGTDFKEKPNCKQSKMPLLRSTCKVLQAHDGGALRGDFEEVENLNIWNSFPPKTG